MAPASVPLHVLIADDDAVSRFLVRSAVERLGHVCTVAGDGGEALTAFERSRPGVLITDWRMPGLDGTALTRRVRERAADGYTYVIVLTGEADEEAAREAMEAGADELIEKPLDAAALERQLIAARRVIDMHDRLLADARVDALTGIPNRRAMNEELGVLRLRAIRYGHDLAAVLFDLDRFKAYNDLAGHLAGDGLLRQIADTLKSSLRGSDSIYRYGGEEFLALLPDQEAASAQIAAERLRATVVGLGLVHPAGGLVTISGGIAALRDDEPAEQLLARADSALYAAKQAGRDCICVAEELLRAQ
jgi:two-component system cell cycle response regulator